ALYNRASQRWMLLVSTIARPPISTLFPYTTLFRSLGEDDRDVPFGRGVEDGRVQPRQHLLPDPTVIGRVGAGEDRIDSLGGPGQLAPVARIGRDVHGAGGRRLVDRWGRLGGSRTDRGRFPAARASRDPHGDSGG